MKKVIFIFSMIFSLVLPFTNSVFAYTSSDLNTNIYGNPLIITYPVKTDDIITITMSGNSIMSNSVWLYDDANKTIKTFSPSSSVGDYSYTFTADSSFIKMDGSAKVYAIKINDSLIFEGTTHLYKELTDITGLSSLSTHNSVTFNWSNPSNEKFTGVKILRDDLYLTTLLKDITTYTDNDVIADTSYTYKFIALYGDSLTSPGVSQIVLTKSVPVDESTIPPGVVTSLTAVPSTKSVKLSWVNPTDDDLAGIQILQGGEPIADLPVTTTYEVTNLKPNTSYQFTVKAYDLDNNYSPAAVVNTITLEEVDNEAPAQVKNVVVTTGSEALFITWDNNKESDLKGYDVYLDGQKHNTTIIKNNFYSIGGLVNDQSYKITVVAVDNADNESEPSTVVTATPVAGKMPIVETEYDLKDVADGVSSWFSSYWLIIAFASAIPLSFYIASKLKLLFIER